ncbi:MAG: T9SS type A sorting domain-containing protein [Flavobacteriales bacterium]|nr:T9SS type A sorting domain-containing protein [Flavobacteriales bacterium]
MNISLRSLTIGLATLLWGAAFAQPLPPYNVSVAGYVAGCTPNSYVNVTTNSITQPAIDIDVPLDANCGFSIDLLMDSFNGGFILSTPCNGAMQQVAAAYQVNALQLDSTYLFVTFNCNSSTVDCLGILGGPNLPGTACNDNDPNTTSYWSADCVCTPDSSNFYFDCLGVLNGSALPGTTCTYTNDSITFNTGFFNMACVCVSDTSNYDCAGVLNGSSLPGTSCSTPAGAAGTWSADCLCIADSSNAGYDCLGVVNGSNLPGSPCWLTGGGAIGMWDNNCVCQDSTNTIGCSASFWVLQAYEGDSLNPNGGTPIPYELWVWNLSQGGGGMTYSWSFGDGTPNSTDPFPTHIYSDNGPYLLCLTIADATGCTDQYCDSVSIDDDGILNGMIINGEADGNGQRSNGFTINVHNGLTTALPEVPAISELHAWPNPANEDLYVALNARFDGAAMITILDVNGREVAQVQRTLSAGSNQQRIDVAALPAGMYTVRVTDRSSGTITSLRFVRTH